MATPITMSDKGLNVPDDPVIPYIEGDGTGTDIWSASVRVFDAAVEKAMATSALSSGLRCSRERRHSTRQESGFPESTLSAFREYHIGIKGPLTTPVGGGIRSLNVALRQILDLYTCLRPVRWFEGVPSPVKHPEYTNMVIFPGELRGHLRRHRVRTRLARV